jgi:Leucine-rich repeat (LRR) protein
MKSIAAIIILALSIQTPAETFTPPDRDQILMTLKPGHPRLMMDANTLARIKKQIDQDTVAAKTYRRIKREVKETLAKKPSEYSIPDGRRLLSTSRRVKERVRQLAFVYLMEGGKPYLERAWAELEAAAQFKDWNPDHFLDTAEMTYAFAVGYDWLYNHWTEDQRHILRKAIIEKGLTPGLMAYRENAWWTRNHNNWNQVCNGGLGMGALAIADEEPELANEILHASVKSIPLLSGATKLRTLNLAGNKVADISAVSGMAELKTLGLNNNKVMDIAPAAGLAKLETLNIKRNALNDMSMNTHVAALKKKGVKVNMDAMESMDKEK